MTIVSIFCKKSYRSFKVKIILATPEKINKAWRGQVEISQSKASTHRHPCDAIFPNPNLCKIVMKSYPSWSETIWQTIPLIYWCWQLSHECVIVGLWASSSAKQCAIIALYEALLAKRRKPIHPIHLNLAGVYILHTHTHTHMRSNIHIHLHCSILHFWNKVSTGTSVHIYTPTLVWVHNKTYMFSIPPLFFILVVENCRSQLCNCVGVAYLLPILCHFNFISLYICSTLSIKMSQQVPPYWKWIHRIKNKVRFFWSCFQLLDSVY